MAKPSVTLRSVKGSSLTHTEADANFTNLRDATISVTDSTTTTAIDLNGTITFSAGGQLAVSESAGTITYSYTGLQNVVEDTTPQLGGNLDVQSNNIITSTTNGNIALVPNGTGTVDVQSALDVDNNITVADTEANGFVTIASASNTTAISLTINDNVALPSVELNPTDDEIILTAGTITLGNVSYDGTDGTAGQFLKTDGLGTLSFADEAFTSLVQDTTPQLGGDLDAQSTYKITNLVDPTANQDGATKAYVDSAVSGASVTSSTKTIIEARNASGATIAKGVPVYIAGHSGSKILIAPADADDATKMPAIGLMDATTANNTDCNVVAFGNLTGVPTNTFSVGATLYISTTPGGSTFGGLTTTKPTGETALVQNIGKVARSDASVGQIIVSGPGRSNDVPNLDNDQFFLGNASNQAVATDFSTAVQAISIDYADLSVTTAAAGSAALSYNNTTGVFTYTPPDLSSYGTLSNVVEDLTPQLGGDLDLNGNEITDSSGPLNFDGGSGVLFSQQGVTGNAFLSGAASTGIALIANAGTGNANVQVSAQGIVIESGTDGVDIDGLIYPNTDGTTGQFLKTDGVGNLSFATVTQATGNELENVVEDLTPQLGGNLDVNGNTITSGITNGNVTLNANGNGIVDITSPTKIQEIKQVVETINSVGNTSGSITVDHANAIQIFNLTAATTIAGFTTPTEGATVTLVVTGGSGVNTLSFSETNSTFYINGGANPTMTGLDVLTMTCINDTVDSEEYLIAHVAVEEIV